MKVAIILNDELGKGFLANAAACIASGLFNNETGLVGEEIEGTYLEFIPITKIPILIYKKSKEPWKNILKSAKRKKLKYMVFTREGQSTTSYKEYIERVKGKKITEVDVIGFGVLGDDEIVDKFSGSFSLLK